MDLLKKSIGLTEGLLGQDLVDETEFVAGLDQAAEGILRSLKATKLWQQKFPKTS
jgi:hypothetical protein